MRYCIAVQEILRREVIVEADNLTEAIERVDKAYSDGKIVLGADDIAPDEDADVFVANWRDEEEVQKMKLTEGI